MNSKLAFKVGLFVLFISVVFAYLIIMFSGKGFGVSTKEYYIYFQSVEGLSKGADVQVKGVKAGKVEDISIEKGKVKVKLSIRGDFPIYKDAKAYIRTLGLMGDKYVYIDPGTPSTGKLPEHAQISQGKVYASTEDLFSSVSDTAKKLGQLVENINRSIEEGKLTELITNIRLLAKHADELIQENRKNVRETIANIKELSYTLKKDLPELIAKIDKAADNIAKISGENREDIRQLIRNLREVSASLKEKTPKLVDNLNRTVSIIGETVDENRQNIKKTIKHLEKSAEKFEKILAKVEEGKGTLGKLINDDKLYEDVRGGIKTFAKPFAIVDKSQLDILMYGEKHTGNTDAKAGIAAIFSSKPDRYIYLGVLSNSNGVVSREEEIKTSSGRKVYIKRDYGILFDVQYARAFWKIYGKDLWIRAGLKESSADIGIDLSYSRNLLFESNLYKFDRDEAMGEPPNPELDIGVRYVFDKYPFFLKFGGSDLLNKKYIGVYFGGGFLFKDQDLKYLLGSMPKP